jgi:type I restriction-modification system DNA methylase subunit
LCESFAYLSESKQLTTSDVATLQKNTFYGKEKKSLAYIIGTMNMILHGIDAPNLIHTNTLGENIADIQEKIYAKAFAFRESNTHEVNSWEEFQIKIEEGGFLSAHWDGTSETEEKIKELTKATIRCIPLGVKKESGTCILTGAPSEHRVIFARAY